MLRQSLANAAVRMARKGHLPAPDAHEVDGSIEALLQWLSFETDPGWLLVLDNIDRKLAFDWARSKLMWEEKCSSRAQAGSF